MLSLVSYQQKIAIKDYYCTPSHVGWWPGALGREDVADGSVCIFIFPSNPCSSIWYYSNYLTFCINFIIFVRTPCMNGARTKLLITLGKFYKLRVQKEKPAVFASHPHTVGPARRSSGNACGVAFSLTSGTAVEQTDYRQTPTPPTARWLRK